jgi:hypothetical protein
LQVGYKEKLAVVLFASKAEAQACARDQDGKGLGEDFKVRIACTLPCLCRDFTIAVSDHARAEQLSS